jgi:hypothetical protein
MSKTIDSEIITPAIPSASSFECSISGTSLRCHVGNRLFTGIDTINVHFQEITRCTLSGSSGEKKVIDCKTW